MHSSTGARDFGTSSFVDPPTRTCDEESGPQRVSGKRPLPNAGTCTVGGTTHLLGVKVQVVLGKICLLKVHQRLDDLGDYPRRACWQESLDQPSFAKELARPTRQHVKRPLFGARGSLHTGGAPLGPLGIDRVGMRDGIHIAPALLQRRLCLCNLIRLDPFAQHGDDQQSHLVGLGASGFHHFVEGLGRCGGINNLLLQRVKRVVLEGVG